MKPLDATPNEMRETADDSTARAMLVQLGVLDRLLDLSRQTELAEPRADMVCDTDHATHWIFGVYYHGYPSATDNGYTLRCFPKSVYTLEQFRAAVRRDIGGTTPIDYQETWEGRPPARHS